MWFRDEGEEKLVRMIGLSGELPESQSDFVAVVEANINGFKTDKVIAETIRHDAAIDADGAITDTLTLHRTHQGNMRSESFYRKVNKTYLRVLVPKGSELLSSEGFTCDPYTPLIDYTKAGYAVSLPVSAIETSTRPEGCVDVGEESGRTFFGGWTFVSPGETLNIRLTYRLPVRISGSVDSYRLVVAKQPGRDAALYKSVHVDSSWQVAWHDERLQEQEANTFASIVHPLAYNELFGIVLKQE